MVERRGVKEGWAGWAAAQFRLPLPAGQRRKWCRPTLRVPTRRWLTGAWESDLSPSRACRRVRLARQGCEGNKERTDSAQPFNIHLHDVYAYTRLHANDSESLTLRYSTSIHSAWLCEQRWQHRRATFPRHRVIAAYMLSYPSSYYPWA